MDLGNTNYKIIAVTLEVICLVIIIFSIKKRSVPGAKPLMVLMIGIFTYSLLYFFQLGSKNIETSLLLYNLSLPGANVIAPAWLWFALSWAGINHELSRRNNILFTLSILIIPMVVTIAAWTNPGHELYGNAFHLNFLENSQVLSFEFGIFYHVGLIYAYSLTGIGVIIFLSAAVQRIKIFYMQTLLILLGMLIPIAFNLFYVGGETSSSKIDLSPFAFVITGIFWAVAIFYYKLLNIIPIARRSVFSLMPVGMIVLDNEEKIVDINQAAMDLLELAKPNLLGHRLPQSILEFLIAPDQNQTELSLSYEVRLITENAFKTLEVRQTNFFDMHNNYIGKLLLFDDITRRKAVEEELVKSEVRLLKAQEVAKVGNWELDLKNQKVIASDEAYRIYGLERTPEHLELHEILQIPLRDERSRLDAAMNDLIHNNIPYDLEFRINRRTDGARRIIHSVASITNDEDGKPATLVGVIQDITERKLAEEALQQSEIHFRSFFEQAAVGVVVTDAQSGKLLKVNRKLGDMLGYQPEEIIGVHYSELTHPDDVKISMENVDSLFTGKFREYSIEKRYRHKSGDYIWTSITTAGMWQPGEEPTTYIAIIQDISERKQTEKALAEHENRYKELVENLGEGIAIVDEFENFTFANPAAHKILGVPQQSLIGRNLKEFLEPESQKYIEAQTEERRQGKTNSYEIEITRSRGDKIIIQLSSRPQKDEQGNFIGSFGVFRDISEQKRSDKVQRVIYKIAQAMISTIGIEELYVSIHSILKELLPVENFYIALYDKSTDLISYPYVVDQYDEPPEPKNPGRGLTEYVLRTGKPALVTPEVFDLLVDQGEVEPLGSDSVDWIGSPLIVDGRIIGVMVMQSYTESTRFSQEDLHLLEFVSNQVALAIERKRVEEAQQHQSTHDNLTGLYNRQYYELEIQRLQRSRQFPISILMMDVDGLKSINDAYGHSAGDDYLRRVASILKTAFRPEDMVARIGGDEFIAVLPETNSDSAKLVVNRLLHSFEKHNSGYLTDFKIEISIGTACGDENSLLTEVYKQADKAMYKVKAEKKIQSAA